MEISNLNLLQITAKKVYHEPEKETEDALVNDTVAAVNTCNNSLTGDELTISGQTVGLFRDISDAKLNAMYCAGDIVTMRDAGNVTEGEGVASAEGATGTGGATGTDGTAGAGGILAGATKGDSDVIKATLYNYFHPKINFINTGYSFNNTDELFAWFEAQGIKGAKTGKKITKADLTQLIHKNEANEDANADFLGILNRAFSEKGAEDTITYKEINNLLIKAAGTDAKVDVGEFKSKVEQYAAKVQKEYEKCGNNQAKLEFILKKTEEYLDAAGLEIQKAALDRLKNKEAENTDPKKNQVCHVGQIAFADYGENRNGILGQYSALESIFTYVNSAGTYSVGIWATDNDNDAFPATGEYVDLGLTLWDGYLDVNTYPWYAVVATMVHELTHATAFYYCTPTSSLSIPTEAGIEHMLNTGVFKRREDDPDYKLLLSLANGTKTMGSLDEQTLSRIAYLITTMYGEYRAYQTDADYLDSLGADVMDIPGKWVTNYDGSNEKKMIEDHIDSGYNYDYDPVTGEATRRDKLNPLPDWKWWTA